MILLDFDGILLGRLLGSITTMVYLNLLLLKPGIRVLRDIRVVSGPGMGPLAAKIWTYSVRGFVAVVGFITLNAFTAFMVFFLIKSLTGGFESDQP